MKKETYQFNFDDTPLTLQIEDMVNVLKDLKTEADIEKLTAAELTSLMVLKNTILGLPEDFTHHLYALMNMHGVQNNLEKYI